MAKKPKIFSIFLLLLLPFQSVVFLVGWILFYFGLRRIKKEKKKE